MTFSLRLVFFSLCLLITFIGAPAAASKYGQGSYSACKLQAECQTPTPSDTPQASPLLSSTPQADTPSPTVGAAPSPATPRSASPNPITHPIQYLQRGLDEIAELTDPVIRSLPAPVAAGIPYLLLVILLLITLALLTASRNEIAARQRLELLIARARMLTEQKDGFTRLTSHYLRTPLSLIQSGSELITPPLASATAARLSSAIQALGTAIEALLTHAGANPQLQTISEPTASRWFKPLVWLPLIIAVSLLIVVLNYLVLHSGRVSFSIIGTLTQFGLYTTLVVGFFVTLRSLQIHNRQRRLARMQHDQQAAIDEARNYLIQSGSAAISEKLEALTAVVPSLPNGQGTQTINTGAQRISAVVKRFRSTATVIPPVTALPYTTFEWQTLMTDVQTALAATASAKSVTLAVTPANLSLASQQPQWIKQVLATVLDNAIGYSSERGVVTTSAAVKNNQATITVMNRGIAVPPEKIARLFQPFTRAEGAISFDHPGLGLNLYLDKLLITALGGTITLESQPGQNTSVTITFPVSG